MKTINDLPLSTLTVDTATQAYLLISGIGARVDYSDRISFPILQQFLTDALSARIDALAATVAAIPTTDTSTLTSDETLRLVPSGAITMWSGSSTTIPTGWLVCDGSNSTPDLRGRFVLGSDTLHVPGFVGGNTTGVSPIVVANGGAATISVTATTDSAVTGITVDAPLRGQVAGGGSGTAVNSTTIADPGHVHTLTGTGTTPDHTHTTSAVSADQLLPPYYALCYIMKS